MAAISLTGLISSVPATSASADTKMQWLADALIWADAKNQEIVKTDSRAGLLYSRDATILENMVRVTFSELTSINKGVSSS